MTTLSSVDVGVGPLCQLVVSGQHLGAILQSPCRLIAARSSHTIQILKLENSQLTHIGYVQYPDVRLTDMQFCPYSYPELIYCCSDGSIHVVRLDETFENLPMRLHSKEWAARSDLLEDEETTKCLCCYGMHPRQVLFSLKNCLSSLHGGLGALSYREGYPS